MEHDVSKSSSKTKKKKQNKPTKGWILPKILMPFLPSKFSQDRERERETEPLSYSMSRRNDRSGNTSNNSSGRYTNNYQHQYHYRGSTTHGHNGNMNNNNNNNNKAITPRSVSLLTVAKASLVIRRRLSFDPDNKLYFLYEPGKQVSSAVRIKNVSRSYVAFKFQTNAPKSCYMRPPGAVLAPKESILASVAKFVEPPEHSQGKLLTIKEHAPEKQVTTKDKFKIVSLKVKEGTEYAPELFEEQKEYVTVERILRVVFLDPLQPCQELDKLKKRLAEAEAIKQTQKKPQGHNKDEKLPAVIEGVIDEWKERREKYLAQQQEEIAVP